MENESKKQLIFRIYQILENYTDDEHHLNQQDIIDILKDDYNLVCERKSIARNIIALTEMGFEIEHDYRGYYLAEHNLEKSELRLLIDSVLSSKNINEKHSKDLIEKLIKLGGKNFKSNVKHVYSVKDWNKSENKNFFLNIELVDEAIEKNIKISFDYIKKDVDKKDYIATSVIGSPYQMILHNQKYYLMLKDDKFDHISFYKLDKISRLKLLPKIKAVELKSIPTFERGIIDYNKLSTAFPYLYHENPETVIVKCQMSMADEICDWFGQDVIMTRNNDDTFNARIIAGEQAMLFWCLQFNKNVEVIAPESLKEKVINTLKETLAQYQ